MNNAFQILPQKANLSKRSHFLTPLFLEFLDMTHPEYEHGTQKYFKLTQDLVYYSQQRGSKIVVPKNYATDFASVPAIFLSLIPRVGTYGKATVVHDYLCDESEKSFDPIQTRKEADEIFLEAMKVLDVPVLIREVMFIGVRLWAAKLSLEYFLSKYKKARMMPKSEEMPYQQTT